MREEADVRRGAVRGRPAWYPWAPLSFNVAAYVGLGVVATCDTLGLARFAVWPVLGLVLAGCLAAAHDCFHKTFLRSARANRVAGAIWSAPVLMNFTATKLAHMVHHRRTRVEGDSEHRLCFRRFSEYLWFVLSPTAVPRSVLGAVQTVVGGSRSPYAKTARQRRDVRIDGGVVLVWLAVAAAVTAWRPMSMLSLYWGPLVCFWPMALLVAIPEHYGCADGPDPLDATRTTTSSWLVRTLIWNSNYHAEHHVHPSAPGYELPRLHRAVRGRLRYCASGYFVFHVRMCVDLLLRRNRGSRDVR